MVASTQRRYGEASGNRHISNKIAIAFSAFLFGCIVSTMVVLNYVAVANSPVMGNEGLGLPHSSNDRRVVEIQHDLVSVAGNIGDAVGPTTTTDSTTNPLVGQRILIAIAAYNFNQIPHLGEVLDAYQDLCVTGASKVDIVIHATEAYPVTLIDLLNSRLLPGCRDIFSITIVLKKKSLRLHLVDCHRELFYRNIDQYDLFIYTEDDIRVPPRVVGAYLAETKKVQDIVGLKASSNFNVGIVRYEYNFPSNVVMDDKTRQATLNVSRVYWEHGFSPVVGGAVRFIKEPRLEDSYIQMQNNHQGMFLATRYLLKAWKERENCHFDIASNRPGQKKNPNQPAEGTQRVWMSSRMLHGSKYCNVQQVLPLDSFGTLTVMHLPNKNYRRVGRMHDRVFSDGTEEFEVSSSLLTAMRLHVEIRNATNQKPYIPYNGVTMVDERGNNRNKRGDRSAVLERRLREYQAYVDRGGILSKYDMGKTALMEER